MGPSMNSTSTSISSLLRSRLITLPFLSTRSLPFMIALVSTISFSFGQYCTASAFTGSSSALDFSMIMLVTVFSSCLQIVEFIHFSTVFSTPARLLCFTVMSSDCSFRYGCWICSCGLSSTTRSLKATPNMAYVPSLPHAYILRAAVDGRLTLVLRERLLVHLQVDLLHLDAQVAHAHTHLRAVELATVQNEAHQHYLAHTHRTYRPEASA